MLCWRVAILPPPPLLATPPDTKQPGKNPSMRDLYLSECRRYLRACLILAGAHLMLQLFLSRLGNIFQQGWPMQLVILAVCMFAGLGLALHQIGSYRQPSRWLWLLHRPLQPGTVLGALALAAATLIALAIGLPLLLTALGTDFLSQRTIDTRHYLAVPYLTMMALIAWLCGVAVMTSRSRFAFLVVLLPWLLLAHAASAVSLLLASVLCAALLAWHVHAGFTPGRMVRPGSIAMLAQATPLLIGMYCVLLWGTLAVFHIAQVGIGRHPLTLAVPPAGGYTEASRADGRTLMLAGLAGARDVRVPHWRRQLPMLEVATLQPNIKRHAVAQQLSNLDAPSQAELVEQQQRLTFSFDSMRFDVHDMRSGALLAQMGLRGMGDSQPFPGVPMFAGKLLTARMVLAFDATGQALLPQVTLPAGEQLAAVPKTLGERLYLLSNGRLIVYTERGAAYVELFSVPLAGPLSDLERVDIVPLLDGTLVSLTGGRAMEFGVAGGQQTVLFVDGDGQIQPIAMRAIGHDYPLLFEHARWWLSPVMHALFSLPQLVFDDGHVPDLSGGDALHRTRPATAWIAALLVSLMSVAGAIYWRHQDRRVMRGWLPACALLGPPCLLLMLALHPRSVAQRVRQPASALVA